MNQTIELLLRTVLIGVGGSAAMDLWALLLRCSFGVRSLDYGLFGRWVGHLIQGRFIHENIAESAPVSGERIIGWTFHYLIGILFAWVLTAFCGLQWVRHPSLPPALIVGIATVIAPYFILQPGMGLGIAASKTPQPAVFRLRTLATHCIYGLGLYGSAVVTSILIAPVKR